MNYPVATLLLPGEEQGKEETTTPPVIVATRKRVSVGLKTPEKNHTNLSHRADIPHRQGPHVHPDQALADLGAAKMNQVFENSHFPQGDFHWHAYLPDIRPFSVNCTVRNQYIKLDVGSRHQFRPLNQHNSANCWDDYLACLDPWVMRLRNKFELP